jgi:serine phosphatase RsbU (regulator of sigma subunit)
VSSPPQIAERILRDSDEFAAYRDADDDLTLLVASVRTG